MVPLMRGVASVIVCLVVLATAVAPAFAALAPFHAHGMAVTEVRSEPSGSGHGAHVSGNISARPHGDAVSVISDICGGGEGAHCSAAVFAPARVELPLRLSCHVGIRLPEDALGSDRTPETEAPPPRV